MSIGKQMRACRFEQMPNIVATGVAAGNLDNKNDLHVIKYDYPPALLDHWNEMRLDKSFASRTTPMRTELKLSDSDF
ncbi:hypothetical protein H2199_004671 [Coniosporium tulheliwenetii]|uniref:Uncharacterized protein n=1 Tax=Coniosporium tulheliwenetii TaxID=3383036 RepID=A0ACC2Z4P5_9PEZI|nr:hypothetical protein H2199_004671 [Cladosporium sp. JES 115]